MNRGTIDFEANNVDYGYASFDVSIMAADLKGHVNFLGDTKAWQLFGHQLQTFPQHTASKVAFESGLGDESILGDYLLLEAYCYDAMGHAALRIITDNKEQDPMRRRLEFSIPAETASINYLGRLLANWQVENNPEITWQAQTS